jgi:hypothetical protein
MLNCEVVKMITYKLLNNATGVITTRRPTIIQDDLKIAFIDAPKNATAIFGIKDGYSIYRKLNDSGECSLEHNALNGVVDVTVAVLDDTTPLCKWECEDICAEKISDGKVLVYPDDNLSKSVVDLRIENHSLRIETAALKAEVSNVKQYIERIVQAYDFT